MKPGYLTSEFLLSAIVIVAATLLKLFSDLTTTEWTTAVTGAVGAYNVSRGLAKVAPPKAQ